MNAQNRSKAERFKTHPKSKIQNRFGVQVISQKAFRYCLVSVLLVVSLLASGDNSNARGAKGKLRVLFIGNSLTYVNDLPAIVGALAEASGQGPFIHKSVAYPDLSLEDHWNRGDAQRAIAGEKWDVVVLQQGPSGLEESRKLLLEYTRLFAKEIRSSGAKPALYMVWPSQARFKDFDRVVESYKLAADDVKAILFPVGQAWRHAWKSDPDIALYSEDKFHPSIAGSYLAALVIYEKLFAASPVGLPAHLKLRSKTPGEIDLGKEQARLLQVAASEANKNF